MFYQEQVHSFAPNPIWTVTDLNRAVSSCLEANFPPCWVKGEIRGLTMAASGHWYFTLKDEHSEISCAMFAGANRRVTFRPKTGDRVEVRGRVSIYAPRGSYQLVVDAMRHEGLGELYARYLELKARLQAEGLFDASRKKAIARVNFKICVVTSLKAAALQDVIRTLKLRAPYVQITVYPTSVQGAEAPAEIVRALVRADQSDGDVVLLVRGGGSLQDLWAFNDERVAKCVAGMNKPVISGVGHESDETIVDYVADLRAATPTAAAQAATEDQDVLFQDVDHRYQTISHLMSLRLKSLKQRVSLLRQAIPNPKLRLQAQAEHFRRQKGLLETFFIQRQYEPKKYALNETKSDLHALFKESLSERALALQYSSRSLLSPSQVISGYRESVKLNLAFMTQAQIATLKHARVRWERTHALMVEASPETILQKGYTYVTGDDGRLVRSSQVGVNSDELTVHWIDGVVVAKPLKAKTIKANG